MEKGQLKRAAGRLQGGMSMCRISGIIIEHGKDDFGYWEGFYLTEEEENAIWDILRKHDTEGYSIRGTQKEIAEEIGE